MSPLPARMRNRWADRQELAPDRGMVYWHVLIRDHSEVCSAADDVQEVLRKFSGFHMTPREWLHMTTLLVGSTDEVSRTRMSEMVSEVRRQLGRLEPVPVTLDKILYHPEAVMLHLQPVTALRSILDAAQTATGQGTGSPPSSWVPHVTVAYSTAEQPAGPIIAALGRTLQERHARIDSVTLVIQWGPERLWNWEPVETVRLQGI